MSIKSVCAFYPNQLRIKEVVSGTGLYSLEVAIISLMEATIFVSLCRHNLLFRYAKMKFWKIFSVLMYICKVIRLQRSGIDTIKYHT